MAFQTSQEAYNYLTEMCDNIEDPFSNNELIKIFDKSKLHLKLANYYKSIPEEQAILLFNYHYNCVYYYTNLYLERCKLI
jgi:hypothetical protein